MKIVVKSGRTVHHGVKAGVNAKYNPATGDEVEPRVAPVVKRHGPGSIIDVPDEDAKSLIARGAAIKYEPPKVVEAEKGEKGEK